MPTKSLEQVAAYVTPELKAQLKEAIAMDDARQSMSTYIERVLRRHLSKSRKNA